LCAKYDFPLYADRSAAMVLRHGKAQSLLDSGVSLDGLKLLLGHEKISTTEIYAQSSPTKLLNELKAIDMLKKTQDINNEKDIKKEEKV